MEIFKLLNESSIVLSFDVLDYKKWEKGRYYKLKIVLVDHSSLFVREYLDEVERHYSFQWQTTDNELIVRWDNAKHYKELKTYPNHKHLGGKVVESIQISLKEILDFIEKTLHADSV